MPDAFMPDVQVDIAFNAGFMTPAASRTWTDVSAYVELHEGIDINFGRQDERSVADANQMTLTLDNKDGRFTAFRAASPYYPNVKIGRPIRVRVTPPGGSTVTRFVGFIDEWPVEWDGTDSYARAKIRATSRLSRLGLIASLRSAPDYSIMASGPSAYWPLGEPSAASTAFDVTSGRQLVPILSTAPGATATPVAFGQGVGSKIDGLPAPTFSAGYYLQAEADDLPPGAGFTLRALVRVGATPAVQANLISYTWQGVTNFIALLPNGKVFINGQPGVGFIADGDAHDLALKVVPGVSAELFIDAVSVSTGAPATAVSPGSNRLAVGDGFTGSIAHVAFYSSALSSSAIIDQAIALINGYAPERTDLRFSRLLGWAGVPATEITAQVGNELMTYQQTSGQQVVEALRQVEATEVGVIFDGRDGNVVFQSRANRYQGVAAATLNMSAQHVGADYLPKLDRSTLINDATVTNPNNGQAARATATSSQSDYGIATQSVSSLTTSYDSLRQGANWLVAAYADPRIRVPSLTVDVLAHQGLTPSARTLLGLTVGDVLAVTNAPTQADSTSASYFVEGYTERIGPESYSLTFNLSPTYPTLNVLVLDDANRGKLDTGLLAL